MKSTLYMIVLIGLIVAGYFVLNSRKEAPLAATPAGASFKTPMAIVFCDFTTSLDSGSKEKVISDALTVYDSLSKKFSVRFYSVSDKVSNCFFENKIDNKTDPSYSEKQRMVHERQQEKGRLQQLLRSFATGPNIKGSCIINCIEQAHREFANYDEGGNSRMILLFLSDMLECCNSAPIKINMETQTARNFNYCVGMVDSIKARCSFKFFKNLKIYVTLSTNKVQFATIQNEFWQKVFARYGFNNAPNLSTSLPRSYN